MAAPRPRYAAFSERHSDEPGGKRAATNVDDAKESLRSPPDEVTKDLAEDIDAEKDISSLEPGPLSRSSGAVLRQLHAVVKEQDPTFGGLEKVRNNRREALWVHPRYVEIYSQTRPSFLFRRTVLPPLE